MLTRDTTTIDHRVDVIPTPLAKKRAKEVYGERLVRDMNHDFQIRFHMAGKEITTILENNAPSKIYEIKMLLIQMQEMITDYYLANHNGSAKANIDLALMLGRYNRTLKKVGKGYEIDVPEIYFDITSKKRTEH